MTTAIILAVALAALAFSIALIFKYKNAPITEKHKTDRRKSWFDFRLKRLDRWAKRRNK